MIPDHEDLRLMDFFSNLTSDEIDFIATFMEVQNVKPGGILTRKGESAHTLYVVLSGKYEVRFSDSRNLIIEKQGEIMGWSAAVAPFIYTAEIKALTDGKVLAIPAEDIQELTRDDSALSLKLTQKIHLVAAMRAFYIERP